MKQLRLLEFDPPKVKVRKIGQPFQLCLLYGDVFASMRGGQAYPRDGRDLKAAKVFLELYPDFFTDEAEQTRFREAATKHLNDPWWHKPDGDPPMSHQLWQLIEHLGKYNIPTYNAPPKKKAPERKIEFRCEFCGSMREAQGDCPKADCRSNK